MQDSDTDYDLFACLDGCPRLPGLDRFGTGGGLVLQVEDVLRLVDVAAERWPAVNRLTIRNTISSYLASYVSGGKSWLLADAQRDMMLQALHGLAGQASAIPMQAQRSKRRKR